MNRQSPIRIGMVLFPKLTQLDLTGPYEVLNSHPRTRIDLLWHRLEPVEAQGGLILTPSAAFGAMSHRAPVRIVRDPSSARISPA